MHYSICKSLESSCTLFGFVGALASPCTTRQRRRPMGRLQRPRRPGQGKHIVLISGDEEYRSEEALPQLGKILAKHHGFDCRVLFAIDPKTGLIDPEQSTKYFRDIESIKDADLIVVFTALARFAGRPIANH